MPGTTPLLSIAYPVAADAPEGHIQMETIARALEQYGVLVASSASNRDSLITAPLKHEGTVCFLTDQNCLQLWDGSAWQTVWTVGDKAVQRGAALPAVAAAVGNVYQRTTDGTLWYSTGSSWVNIGNPADAAVRRGTNADMPAASSVPGMIYSKTNDDSVWFSNGVNWLRMNTWNDPDIGDHAYDGTLATSSSTLGAYNPATGSGIYVAYVSPPSGWVQITMSALMRVSAGTGSCFFGYEVTQVDGTVLHAKNLERAARHASTGLQSASWVATIDIGARAGETLRVHGVHGVTTTGTATYQMREMAVRPWR